MSLVSVSRRCPWQILCCRLDCVCITECLITVRRWAKRRICTFFWCDVCAWAWGLLCDVFLVMPEKTGVSYRLSREGCFVRVVRAGWTPHICVFMCVSLSLPTWHIKHYFITLSNTANVLPNCYTCMLHQFALLKWVVFMSPTYFSLTVGQRYTIYRDMQRHKNSTGLRIILSRQHTHAAVTK